MHVNRYGVKLKSFIKAARENGLDAKNALEHYISRIEQLRNSRGSQAMMRVARGKRKIARMVGDATKI